VSACLLWLNDNERMLRLISTNEVLTVSGKAEEIKGRVKESAGVLTGNEKLKESGRADKTSGKVKQAITKTVDKVKNAVKRKKP
jgi:uncharacterized protein YjbJ (UPF0337 family)